MPLVATPFQYRRQGMCRLLLQELEKVVSLDLLFHVFCLCGKWSNISIVNMNATYFHLQLLTQLGIERLVLPAIPQLRETWEKSFGFLEMPLSERLQFLGYPFLAFQGTIMLHKFLKNPMNNKEMRGTTYGACLIIERQLYILIFIILSWLS